jgi:hypothetical protein
MLAGFTSRWMTPAACRCASTSQTFSPMRATSLARIRVPAARISLSRRPSTRSVTQYGAPPGSVPASYSATSPGWLARASVFAS